MKTEEILSLMAILGAFIFLGMGLCLGNSIEAKDSEKTANIMLILMLIGIASFLVGFFGLIIFGILKNKY